MDLKDQALAIIDEKFNELKFEFLTELKDCKKVKCQALKMESRSCKSSNQPYHCCKNMLST